MKITLAEWRAFEDAWSEAPEGKNWCYDDQLLPTEDDFGNKIAIDIDPATKFELTGFMQWQGNGKPKPSGFFGNHGLDTAVKKWRKLCAFETRVIDIPKDKMADVQAALAAFGIKV